MCFLPVKGLLPKVTFIQQSGFLCEVVRGFPHFLHVNTIIVCHIRPRPLPFTFFPVHYLRVISSFDTVKSEPAPVSSNKPNRNEDKNLSNLPTLIIVSLFRSRYRPGVAQRVGRGIALLFHDRGTRRG